MNTSVIADIKLNSLEEGCRELANILGLDAPVEPAVLVSAVQSEEYARNLLICRGTPAFMQTLLDNPVKPAVAEPEQQQGTVGLLKKASKALVNWGKTGFSVASAEVIEQRLKSCLKCPNIRQSTGTNVVYKLLKTEATCGLCGCDIEKKARLSSESCPGQDPHNPGYNRWGQLAKFDNLIDG